MIFAIAHLVLALIASLFLASVWTAGTSLSTDLGTTGGVVFVWGLLALLIEAVRRDL